MSDVMITDGMKQTVITRTACINSAISIFNLTKGKPTNVSVEEVFTLAERLESWAWRNLLSDRTDAQVREKLAPSKAEGPTDSAPPTSPAKTEPQPPPAKDDQPQPNGNGQRAGEASEKQINAIFAIGKSKGYTFDDLKTEIKARLGKSVDALTGREASKLIDDLRAL